MSTQKIIEKFRKNLFELEAWSKSNFVIGIDEVGRGCLAGPVITAAVALFPHANHPLLRDSKDLTRPELEKAYRWLVTHSYFATASASHLTIDSVNIYQATRIAMDTALTNLVFLLKKTEGERTPLYVLIDAVPLAYNSQDHEVRYFIKGEQKSSSIAAASIIAKITRDRLMEKFDQLFPAYGFSHHKGYGTREHQVALSTFGPSSIHRTSFALNHEEFNERDAQQSLC